MPRKSDALTVEELREIKSQLLECKISEPVKEKIHKRIDVEIARRENAGIKGGRPKLIEQIKEIDRQGAASLKASEGQEITEDFDFGA